MDIGIDQIGFYTPNKFVDMVDLANARNQDPNKFLIGIGQDRMAVADKTQDAVSMGINATAEYLDQVDLEQLGLLIFATESGIDQSKSASLFVKEALNLPARIRTFEIKEACFALTASLQVARDYVRAHPHHSAMIIGSDIARYGLATAGEVTQGAGAISMLIKENPAIIALEEGHTSHSENINDFWRPNNLATAVVDGHYSRDVYLDFFKSTFKPFLAEKQLQVSDFAGICYHLPYTKMGYKAHKIAIEGQDDETVKRLSDNFQLSAKYSRQVGNIYTASLYMSVLSLLENGDLEAGDRIGFFSYGSGAMAEFFSGKVVAGYQKRLRPALHARMLKERIRLGVGQYEDIFTEGLEALPENVEFTSDANHGTWYLAGQEGYVRQYKQK
ncbi:hydroxymethylglutaryl-CoA synthase [Lactobacillus delbrueckii]|uniref:hydroxymethylglutaryl-CoA synthase n=1 Tax=Lactobacillus delbrueckii TaxID=1584 RepID=UPI001F243D3E|nr:hydroxymethylglutaryl-CoA synthase [Lactobacillus delbrueckii]GHN19512.1 hydroxymethylglutaryl-CoA synthase [Lactobacillus delbrueckii]GHN21713.1 hydroxymethylglutaryl-CoA synthase [Lactobacillus delbrueckii]GHN62916.1 hydroxymethylglutaryl-CoA synthase [Lactobacillus delbrueckii]